MRQRLVQGVKFDQWEGIKGGTLRGMIESPFANTGIVVGLPPDEADKILDEVAEIKLFLFCRPLLSHAAILPNALKANSIEELLQDSKFSTTDLRDLCLRSEQPALQDIRDACADFFQGDAPQELESEDGSEAEEINDSSQP